MPRGDISKYINKKRHKAEYIAEINEQRRIAENDAASRLSTSDNKSEGGEKQSSSAQPTVINAKRADGAGISSPHVQSSASRRNNAPISPVRASAGRPNTLK
jgi:hypothetical protein